MGLNSFQTSGNSPGTRGCLVGILGFGTVASAIAGRLTGPDSIPSLELTHIGDRRAHDKGARPPESSTNRIVIVPALLATAPKPIKGLVDHKLAEAV